MKLKSLLAQAALGGAIAFTALTAATPALAQTYTKDQLQQTFMAYLNQEGYNPNITQAGNVRFFQALGWTAVGDPADYLGHPHQQMSIALR